MDTLRHLIFYFLYNGTGIWFGITGWLIGWLPYRYRYAYIIKWNFVALWLARHLVGVNYKIEGRENIPVGACVVMSKHQSQWETFFLQTVLTSVCTILKKELLSIPFFGWGLANLDPIAIDRSDPKAALKEIQQVGALRLSQGRQVLIFPEGTRVPHGGKRKYGKSGASLAIASGAKVLPVAHNAGKYWPSSSFKKNRGEITVSFGPLIDPAGKSAKALTQEVEEWIEGECERIH
jgi:1-acyl-sn-glycerol-3-phosphate acyltransferase